MPQSLNPPADIYEYWRPAELETLGRVTHTAAVTCGPDSAARRAYIESARLNRERIERARKLENLLSLRRTA